MKRANKGRWFQDKTQPGIIRFNNNPLDGVLVGAMAEHFVRALNSYEAKTSTTLLSKTGFKGRHEMKTTNEQRILKFIGSHKGTGFGEISRALNIELRDVVNICKKLMHARKIGIDVKYVGGK